ncbi:MAG: hypothetical protein WD944_09115 [Steroidobacteraceae bacterium]
MPDDTVLDRDLVRRDLPGVRRRLHEHGPRHRPGAAHLFEGIGNRSRAAGYLYGTHQQVVVDFFVRGRVLCPHHGPIRVHLLRHQGRKTRERTLAELDLFDDHGHGVVRSDPNERVRREEFRRLARLPENAANGEAHTDDQRASTL